MKLIAIIPAGGKGLRVGITAKKSIATPKQYLKVNGKEINIFMSGWYACHPLCQFNYKG